MKIQLDTKKKRILLGAFLGALLFGAYGVYSSRYEETDNAYTAAHVATLSAKVAGLVTEVMVEENTKVKKNQVLARLDARDFVNAAENLKGELGAVEASLRLARKDLGRSESLFRDGAVTEKFRDDALAKAQALEKKREALAAQLTQAELNLAFTEIRAPADGTVGKKNVEPGMVVSPGQPLLSFVDSQAPWVVANFKETQLRKMRLGQKVEIEVDSIAGKTFEGALESMAPGTGAMFALIPPDNATGNFTKIVQRVPLRIRFDADSIKGYEDRLVPGLSAEVKVYLHDTPAGSLPAASTTLAAH